MLGIHKIMNWYTKIAQISQRSFDINSDENFIFNFLRQMRSRIPEFSDVQLRICGGLCRDKLLNKPSDDIDIAISFPINSKNKITGEQFIEKINTVASSLPNNPIKKVWVVPANELKSKNIAPAALEILAPSGTTYKVEFVNLRTEEYDDPESRVPTQKITNDPEEDASRRDLTINSIFYNLDDDNIEDYVGGYNDLQKMYLKTPLDPVQTFIDDPLRTLRVLRFYSRYPEAKIDPLIIRALSDPRVHQAYSKLADERASEEIIKMMKGARSVESARLLFETGLYKPVFKIPEEYFDIDLDQQSPYHNMTVLEHTLSVMDNLNKLSDKFDIPDQERSWLLISGLLHDIGKLDPKIRKSKIDKATGQPAFFDRGGEEVGHKRYIGHDIQSFDFANDLMTRMGFYKPVKKFVSSIIKNHMKPHQFAKSMNPKNIGKFMKEVGDLYNMVMYHGMADSVARHITTEEREQTIGTIKGQLDQMDAYWQDMGDKINKTLIDGNRIRQIMQEVTPELVSANGFIENKKYSKPVHFLSFAVDQLLEQQWARTINTPEEAEEFIRKRARQWENIWREQQKQVNKEASKKEDLIYVGLVGYSAQKFNKNDARDLINQAYDEIDKKYKKDKALVSGLTKVKYTLGIPYIGYEEAEKREWKTVGIAPKESENFEWYSCDDYHIVGEEWGDESEFFLDYIDVLIRIGGGDQSKEECKKAKQMKKYVIELELEDTE